MCAQDFANVHASISARVIMFTSAYKIKDFGEFVLLESSVK